MLKQLEDYLPIERPAIVDLTVEGDDALCESLTGDIAGRGYRLVERGSTVQANPVRRQILYELRCRASAGGPGPKDWLDSLAARPRVVQLAWPMGPHTEGDALRTRIS